MLRKTIVDYLVSLDTKKFNKMKLLVISFLEVLSFGG